MNILKICSVFCFLFFLNGCSPYLRLPNINTPIGSVNTNGVFNVVGNGVSGMFRDDKPQGRQLSQGEKIEREIIDLEEKISSSGLRSFNNECREIKSLLSERKFWRKRNSFPPQDFALEMETKKTCGLLPKKARVKKYKPKPKKVKKVKKSHDHKHENTYEDIFAPLSL